MSDVIRTKVKEVISAIKVGVNFENGEGLQQDLAMDSLDMITFYFDLEKAFSIKIPEEDIEEQKLTTLQGVIDYISEKTTE